MIQSMTAFARQEFQGDWGSAAWELRSVNHRYFDLQIRLPENFTKLEPLIREKIRTQIHRGKIEIYLHCKLASSSQTDLIINDKLAAKLIKARASIAKLIPESLPLNASEILNWPGVIQTSSLDVQSLETVIGDNFDQVFIDFVRAREREGEALRKILLEQLAKISPQTTKLKKYLPQILIEQRKKIVDRLAEIKQSLDPDRLEQEMLLYAQKTDVTEEINRIDLHAVEMERCLREGGVVGRKLDFLLQELNREANTLSAKSANIEVTKIAVDLKLLIEQMREQVQNIA